MRRGRANPQTAHRWTFPARLTRLVDADTLIVTLDCGLSVAVHGAWLRLLGVDAYEIRGQEKERGLAATAWAFDWLADAGAADTERWNLLVETIEKDSFGRWIADVYRRDTGESLGVALLAAGHATPYQ